MTTTVEMSERDAKLWRFLKYRLATAERKHPQFAEGPYQGTGRIGEEYGELCQALNHGDGETRVMAEAWDLLVVSWRFVRGDWRGKVNG
jgi:hypothetical protein